MKKQQRGATRQSFLHGALILTLGMVVAKVAGALFKIPIANIITPEGNGYFNAAYELYNPIYSLATAGFPIAVARMVSVNYTKGNFQTVRKIKQVSLPLFFCLGLIGTLIMILGAGLFCQAIGNQYALMPILVLAPTVLFSCLSSIYRGYFEGLRNMYPTATTEVIESVVKLVVGLAGAIFMMYLCQNQFQASGTILGAPVANPTIAASLSMSYGAAGAILGVTIGSICSAAYLFFQGKYRGDGITQQELDGSAPAESGKTIIKQLLRLAIPLAIGAVAMSLAGTVDMVLLNTRINDIVAHSPDVLRTMYANILAGGKSLDTMTIFLYGCYGNALTVYMLIPTVAQAIGTSALPSMTEAWTKGDKTLVRERIESILRIASLVTIPAALGLTALATPIAYALYGVRPSADITANSLRILGIAAIGASLSTPISAMLQAVGRVDIPVKVMLLSVGVKILINYTLCGIPQINIMGAGTGTLVCYSFAALVELYYLRKVSGVSIRMRSTFLKPALAAVICAAAAWGVYTLGTVFFGAQSRIVIVVLLIAAVLCAVVVYAVAMVLVKGLHRDDVLMLPKGQKIEAFMTKRNWL